MRFGLAGTALVVLVLATACEQSPSSPEGPAKRGTSDAPGQGPTAVPTKPGAGRSCADPQNDPHNCGTCGFVCAFANATPLCSAGACVRGACARGWHDLDGDPGSGCEASCTGRTCTTGSGSTAATVTLSAPPLPESGAVAGVFASSGPFAGGDGQHPGELPGVLGEATPLPCSAGGPEDSIAACLENHNQLFENQVGYQAVLR